METDSVLIADPDPALLQNQSCLISSDLPGVAFTACRSSQQTVEKLSFSRYSAVIAASRLIQEDTTSLLQHKRTRHPLGPLVLAVNHETVNPLGLRFYTERPSTSLQSRSILLKPLRVSKPLYGNSGS